MAGWVDTKMISYLTPGNLNALLMPPLDAAHDRLRSLLTEVYDMQYLAIQSVNSVTVLDQKYQVPVDPDRDIRGSLEKIVPNLERTLATFTLSRAPKFWADMQLRTNVAVNVSVTQAALELVAETDLSDLTTLADFQSRFDFIDVQDFMAAAHIATLQELKAEFPHRFRLQFAQPPPYDPNNPASARNYALTINAILADTVDLVQALRIIKCCRAGTEQSTPHLDGFDGGDIRVGSAWMVVFDKNLATQTQQADITAFFASDRIVAAFD